MCAHMSPSLGTEYIKSSPTQWWLGSRGEEVEHTRNNKEEGGGGHDEVRPRPRPVLLPKVVPPVLFRHRSTHVAFVAVAREQQCN